MSNLLKSVVLEDGEEIEGRYFISSTHPDQLLTMIDGLKVSGAFSYRINNIEDTIGMFTLYLVFKKNSFPYLNYNFYQYNQDNVWIAGDYDSSKWPQMYALMPTASSKSETYAESASVLTYMEYDELLKWKDTKTGNRGR